MKWEDSCIKVKESVRSIKERYTKFILMLDWKVNGVLDCPMASVSVETSTLALALQIDNLFRRFTGHRCAVFMSLVPIAIFEAQRVSKTPSLRMYQAGGRDSWAIISDNFNSPSLRLRLLLSFRLNEIDRTFCVVFDREMIAVCYDLTRLNYNAFEAELFDCEVKRTMPSHSKMWHNCFRYRLVHWINCTTVSNGLSAKRSD